MSDHLQKFGALAFALYNKADQTKTVLCTPYSVINERPLQGTASGTMLVECTGIAASTVNSEIDEGTDSTFVLQMHITNPNTGFTVSVLQTTLQSFDDMRKTYGRSSGSSHVQWIDKDQTTNQVFDWIEYPETSVKSTAYSS